MLNAERHRPLPCLQNSVPSRHETEEPWGTQLAQEGSNDSGTTELPSATSLAVGPCVPHTHVAFRPACLSIFFTVSRHPGGPRDLRKCAGWETDPTEKNNFGKWTLQGEENLKNSLERSQRKEVVFLKQECYCRPGWCGSVD